MWCRRFGDLVPVRIHYKLRTQWTLSAIRPIEVSLGKILLFLAAPAFGPVP